MLNETQLNAIKVAFISEHLMLVTIATHTFSITKSTMIR